MEVRIILYVFVVLMGYDLTLADMTKMIFLPNADAQPPPNCPPNEMFKHCLNNCSNCEERGFCSYTSCDQSGCDCWPRFFRLTPEGPCEPVGKCPKKECPENEVFRECGPLCERCGLFGCRLTQCNHQCYCKEGYKRDYFGDCIPEEECPQRQHCSKGEEMADSGPVDEFCLQDPNHPRNTETQNVRKCYCLQGYKRNALGHCIEERLCEYVSCIANEVYMNCVPTCNTTCRNYGDPDCEEDEQCFPGCFCPPGYAMNDYHVCVTLENCAIENERIILFDTHEESKAEESSQTTVSEEQTAIPPEEKTASNSQSEVEQQSESQAEGQTEAQDQSESESQSGVQSEVETDSQSESRTAEELETQAEKPLEAQTAVDSQSQKEEQPQSQEDAQIGSETVGESQDAGQSQSEATEHSEQEEASAHSQAEASASKTSAQSQADTSVAKEKIDGESEEDVPVEESIESPAAASEEAIADFDEPETTTTTKIPIVRQSRRRSSAGNVRADQDASHKAPKRRKQFREEINER